MTVGEKKLQGLGRRFAAPNLHQIAMPMGGIGAGSISLSGNGALADWAIRNRPATTALPDGWKMRDAAFGLLHIKGEKAITRLVEGPVPALKIFDQGLQAQGYRLGNFEGLPRFKSNTFQASYPTGRVDLEHPQIPLEVSVTGFSPFVPLDDLNSGLPCCILEYRFSNRSERAVEFEFSYHVSHLAIGLRGWVGTRNTLLPGFGFGFSNDDKANVETFGTAAVGCLTQSPKIKAMWFRGAWFDFISTIWKEAESASFSENDGKFKSELNGTNGGSLMVAGKLEPGESIAVPLVIAWHFPNVHYRLGGVNDTYTQGDIPFEYGKDTEAAPAWRPWYAGRFKDATEVAAYVKENYATLRARTFAFRDAVFSSTLPEEVIDAVASNLAILKSPTVLRQENGNLWAWEGCWTTHGCCHGSCTHVWNYAQALPHLFPQLERTLREAELQRCMDEKGHVQFRAPLPDGPVKHDFHAAADGQLGGILKLLRDYQIYGDRAWLESLYPLARRSLEFCIGSWDPERKGELAEPHHNTYDIEFWGPDALTTTCYIGALSAMAELAREVGEAADAKTYADLAKRAAGVLDKGLFNGEYHQQRIQWEGLRDQSIVKQIETLEADGSNGQLLKLLKEEGPRYQYGAGCLSDAVIGLWMANLYGVSTPADTEKMRSTLRSIFKYNFKTDLSDHVCTQRPGYAMGAEPGLLLCTWPRGEKPSIPFVYSDEVWTGIEYQVASHLILSGMVEEGLTIVRSTRSRYDGHVRNPFNEYECGSYYARALASYSLIRALTGFRYNAATEELFLNPRLEQRPLRFFFSTAKGFGTIAVEGESVEINLVEGELRVKSLNLGRGDEWVKKEWSVSIGAGETRRLKLA